MSNVVAMQVSDLSGRALDWAVARAMGYDVALVTGAERARQRHEEDEEAADLLRQSTPRLYWSNPVARTPLPRFSTEWSSGGPIIERSGIVVGPQLAEIGGWMAFLANDGKSSFVKSSGATCLEAAMRSYVHARMGMAISIPIELMEGVVPATEARRPKP